jgi:hypothetical protein
LGSLKPQRTSPLVFGNRILEILVGAVQFVELSRALICDGNR